MNGAEPPASSPGNPPSRYNARMAGHVLLIGSDPRVREQVAAVTDALSVPLRHAATVDEAAAAIESAAPSVVLLDVESDAVGGFHAFETLHERWPRLCTLLIAERARSEQAIEAMKRGAIDYLIKPLADADLLRRIEDALRISRDVTIPPVYDEPPRDPPIDRIVGESEAMRTVFKAIGLIAPRDVNVLVTGESGTGKELVARALYHHSQRKDRPFLAVNCAAIPETLLESELFGHEKGAFTGADVRRIGKFEQCDGGTLFLDEIGDLPPATQAKLLRVLQDGSFQRLGGNNNIRTDVRIVAATNQPLEQWIAERKFRQDLYYRLKVTDIHVPPLREREFDAVLLAHYFVRRFNPLLGTQIRSFSPEALPVLLTYSWPGNVRELENAVKAALVVARGNVFQLEFLPEQMRCRRLAPSAAPAGQRADGAPDPAPPIEALCAQLLERPALHGRLYDEAVTSAERVIIQTCLQHTGGNLTAAAALLGITRVTLRKKMARLGLQIKTQVERHESNRSG